MTRLLCAVFFAAMAATPARAAADALAGLKSAVSPSVLESSVPLPSAPKAEVAATPLNARILKGEYLVKAAGMPVLRIILAKDATLIKPDPAGDLVCKGTYKLDRVKMLLVTNFKECGSNSLTHTMFLEGQTVESLQAGAEVLSSVKMDGKLIPSVPVNIKKLK